MGASGGKAPSVANADRISEVYKGEIWDEALQQRARNRIHWLTSHAHGRVLDVGCSQGIASLLVARNGLRERASASEPAGGDRP